MTTIASTVFAACTTGTVHAIAAKHGGITFPDGSQITIGLYGTTI